MAPPSQRTPAGEILTALTMELFRVSGLILNAGDRLAAHLGLTGTRWQILGTIVRAGSPQTVAEIARNLGTSRQNVQRVVNDLHAMEFLTFKANPRHRRAQLVVLTTKGTQAYEAAMELQAPWVNQITDGLDLNDIEVFKRVLLALRERLRKNVEKSDRNSETIRTIRRHPLKPQHDTTQPQRKIEDTHLNCPGVATKSTKSRTPTENARPRVSEAKSGE